MIRLHFKNIIATKMGRNEPVVGQVLHFGPFSQRGLTDEVPENVHFCIQKAATHSRFIRSTPF
jgi:hypothetical protein